MSGAQMLPTPTPGVFGTLHRSDITFSDSDLLGEGFYGQVYKGKFKGQTVAVKEVVVKETRNKDDLLITFSRECDLVQLEPHDNLLNLLGAFTHAGDHLYLVSEFME
ncbi:hypothetical protein KIPB_009218, partial [Kipferlia bialata]|eukprot:g9218.t1